MTMIFLGVSLGIFGMAGLLFDSDFLLPKP